MARYDARRRASEVALQGEKRGFFTPNVQMHAGMSYDLFRTSTGQYANLNNFNNLLSTLDSESALNPNQSYSYANDYRIQTPTQRDFLNWEAGVSVRFPLFSGLKRKGSVDQRKAELITLSHQRRHAESEIESKLRSALVELNASYQAIIRKVFQGSSATWFNFDFRTISKGQRPLVDFNAASEDSLKAEIHHIDSS